MLGAADPNATLTLAAWRNAGGALLALVVALLLVGGQHVLRDVTQERLLGLGPWWVRSAALATLIVLIATTGGEDRAFIYFQF